MFSASSTLGSITGTLVAAFAALPLLGTARAMALFALLLGGLAAYDLINGKAGIYQPLGITPDLLKWVAWGGIAIGVAALLQGFVRRRLRDQASLAEALSMWEEHQNALSTL